MLMILADALALLLAQQHPVAPAMLEGLSRRTVELTAHGKTQSCSGVSLRDVATRWGLPEARAVTGAALGTVIVAEARDGYAVSFTLGELDPMLGDRPVTLVDHCDGQPLSAEDGPFRLVVPGEARAARSVRQLTRFLVFTRSTSGSASPR